MIDESLEAVQSDRLRPDYYVKEMRELEKRGDWEERDIQMDRPSEEGKGLFIDVFV